MLWLTLALSLATSTAHSRSEILVFDEDDPLGSQYYDGSAGFFRAPSELSLTGPFNGKLRIVTGSAFSGNQSGLLEWRSAERGDWQLLVASPGWARKDISAHHFLELAVNGSKPIPATRLPRLRLQSSLNFNSSTVELGRFLPAGLDADSNSWQTISIPLDSFRPYDQFNLSQFKAIVFSQSAADGDEHALWFDAVRIFSTNATAVVQAPASPSSLVALAGDRSVSLCWDGMPGAAVTGYQVFRSVSPTGEFSKISSKPASISSFADTAVTNNHTYRYRIRAVNAAGESSDSVEAQATPTVFVDDDAFLELLQRTAFNYFWHEANPANGLVRDRSQPFSLASIAATGFGLTALGIGVNHGWITREQGATRTLTTLNTFSQMPQGTNLSGMIGHKGWFYHFLEMDTATRAGTSELSSIDTALLLAGVLYTRQFFNRESQMEKQIRRLAAVILNRVDWRWMTDGQPSLSMGWRPDSGFIRSRWLGYNEAMILYLLGLGANRNSLPAAHWQTWTGTYKWETHHGQSFVVFPPLFGHQYSHAWIDFRGIADGYLRRQGIDYFENSRRAALAQRAYAIANPGNFTGYGSNVWGLTACDGPGTTGKHAYFARGTPPPENDDGTIAPTAAGASIAFAPAEALAALRHFYDEFREQLWSGYGFRDAFNLEANWWASDVLGIDQGPILLMIENHRNEGVWRVLMETPEMQRGLKRAGFRKLPERKSTTTTKDKRRPASD